MVDTAVSYTGGSELITLYQERALLQMKHVHNVHPT